MIKRIFPEGLAQTLERGLAPFYLLTGQDLLLVNESKDSIVQTARLQGFDEKNDITIGNDTQWEMLFEQAQSYGLFAQRQILCLNLPENPTASQHKQLATLLALSHADLLFILHFPKWTKAIENQSWCKQISETALQISCQTPDISKMPIWLQQRAKQMALVLESEAVKLLCYSYEGNLLALKQSLQMLQLRFPHQPISLEKAKEVIELSAQFTPFQWVDALLEGKIGRANRILRHLQNEEVQPVVLLRLIQKELLLLLEITRNGKIHLSQPLYNGNLRTEFDRLKVWQNRRGLYLSAVNRLTYRQLFQLIQQLATLEREVKQEFSDEIWQQLAQFSLCFAVQNPR